MAQEKPKNQFYFDPDRKVFHIDGKTYRVAKLTKKQKSEHSSKDLLVEVDMGKYDQRLEKIVDYIESAMDKRKFLRSALDCLPLSRIELLERRIRNRAKVREKRGCYNLDVGGIEIPLMD